MQIDLENAFQIIVAAVLSYAAWKLRKIDQLVVDVAVLKDRSDEAKDNKERLVKVESSYRALHSRVDRVEAINEQITKEGKDNERRKNQA